MNSLSDIFACIGFDTPPRYSLFWHHESGGVDCRIYSSESYDLIEKKWKTNPLYGLACNIK
jgi:hypothetical protein